MTKSIGCLVVALALGLALSPGAGAQSVGGPLKGTQGFKFFVTDLNSDSLRCGLDKSTFQEAFMTWPKGKGLSVTTSSGYWISVRATTVEMDDDLCVTNLDASVMVNSSYFNPATASDRVGRIQLWTQGTLQISSRGQHAKNVDEALRALGSGLAEAWQRDQY
jgi:hypothetical protein